MPIFSFLLGKSLIRDTSWHTFSIRRKGLEGERRYWGVNKLVISLMAKSLYLFILQGLPRESANSDGKTVLSSKQYFISISMHMLLSSPPFFYSMAIHKYHSDKRYNLNSFCTSSMTINQIHTWIWLGPEQHSWKNGTKPVSSHHPSLELKKGYLTPCNWGWYHPGESVKLNHAS